MKTRDNICYRINRAIHQQASYKELSAKAKIVSTFVNVRMLYSLKFNKFNRPSPTHNQKAIKKSYTHIRLVLSKMFASSSNLLSIKMMDNQHSNESIYESIAY